MRPWLAVVAAVCACRGKAPPLYPAGSDKDDGHGLLAQASTQILTGDEGDEGLADDARPRAYGGNGYGGSAYGGASYASYVVPAWPITAPNRTPKYNQVQGLTGAIEGTIALRAPAKLPCGELESRVALVYIEKVQVGRTLMSDNRPANVGGTIVKRGCALVPTAQIATPLPAAISIHGDAKPARVRIDAKPVDGQLVDRVPAKQHELQAGGRVALQLQAGVTRVQLDDGGAAWVVALDTPYYAITDDRGRFRIDELAAGTYDITIWQPPAAKLVNGVVTYGEPIITKRSLKVEAHRASRLDVR